MLDDLIRREQLGREALDTLRTCAPHLDRIRLGVFEAWAREPDPDKRNEAWHLIRAIDVLRTTLQRDVATGEQAASERAYLAERGGSQ